MASWPPWSLCPFQRANRPANDEEGGPALLVGQGVTVVRTEDHQGVREGVGSDTERIDDAGGGAGHPFGYRSWPFWPSVYFELQIFNLHDNAKWPPTNCPRRRAATVPALPCAEPRPGRRGAFLQRAIRPADDEEGGPALLVGEGVAVVWTEAREGVGSDTERIDDAGGSTGHPFVYRSWPLRPSVYFELQIFNVHGNAKWPPTNCPRRRGTPYGVLTRAHAGVARSSSPPSGPRTMKRAGQSCSAAKA